MQLLQPEVIINLKNLRLNFQYIQKKVGDAKVMAVIKGNAYGHGVKQVTSILAEEGVFGFCVALHTEVKEILELGIKRPILHLGRLHKDMLDTLKTGQVKCTINSPDDISILEEYGKSQNCRINAHLKVDTGMTRLGIQMSSIEKCIEDLTKCNWIKLEGLWSHFATADEKNSEFLKSQLNNFNKIVSYVKDKFPKIEYNHIAPSGAILRFPDTFFNMVRPGISLYGATPFGEPDENLKPVMEFRAPISLIKSISENTAVGYNRTFISKDNMKIALIQAGYADGVHTAFSNKGIVLINGKSIPIVGKVAFDLTTVDVTENDCSEMDFVTFWGGKSREMRVENIAKETGKIPYELFTGITSRVKRIYIDE